VKVLMINGSANSHGCTYTALMEVAAALEAEGISCEIAQSGNKPIRDCTACGKCKELDDRCVFDDDIVNGLIRKGKEADGFVFGTPVYRRGLRRWSPRTRLTSPGDA
jgi:multimeric flavodoxin WrbA